MWIKSKGSLAIVNLKYAFLEKEILSFWPPDCTPRFACMDRNFGRVVGCSRSRANFNRLSIAELSTDSKASDVKYFDFKPNDEWIGMTLSDSGKFIISAISSDSKDSRGNNSRYLKLQAIQFDGFSIRISKERLFSADGLPIWKSMKKVETQKNLICVLDSKVITLYSFNELTVDFEMVTRTSSETEGIVEYSTGHGLIATIQNNKRGNDLQLIKILS